MRVLITGGLGFLGQVVTRVLAEHGHEVFVVTRGRPGARVPDGVVIVKADLRDHAAIAGAVATARPEGVCHLAALTNVRDSFADPLGYFEVNVGGTVNLLRALQSLAGNQPVRLVFTSTSAVYGSDRVGLLREDLEPRPENPYAASKVAAEQLIGYYAQTGAIGAVTLRCFNISGGVAGVCDRDTTRIINNALRAAAGEIPRVTVNGEGSAVREFTHVLDVAEAVRLALAVAEPGRHSVFNIGTGVGVTMREVINVAEKVTGVTIPVVRRPPAPEAHTLIADSRRATEVLGWHTTRSSLEQVIRDAWHAWKGAGKPIVPSEIESSEVASGAGSDERVL